MHDDWRLGLVLALLAMRHAFADDDAVWLQSEQPAAQGKSTASSVGEQTADPSLPLWRLPIRVKKVDNPMLDRSLDDAMKEKTGSMHRSNGHRSQPSAHATRGGEGGRGGRGRGARGDRGRGVPPGAMHSGQWGSGRAPPRGDGRTMMAYPTPVHFSG